MKNNAIYEANADEKEYFFLHEFTDSTTFKHFHKSYEFVYCVSGRTKVTIDNVDTIIEADEMYFVPSYIVHANAAVEHNDIISIIISEELFHDFVQEFNGKTFHHFLVNHEANIKIKEFLLNFLRIYKNNNLPKIKIRSFVNDFFYRLIQIYELNETEENKKPSFTDILNYINNNFTDNINLDVLSREFGYNSQYLSRIFNKNMSVSLPDYINNLRYEKSLQLIRNNKDNLSLSQIIDNCGFGSVASYYRIKKQFEEEQKNNYRKKLNSWLDNFSTSGHIYQESILLTEDNLGRLSSKLLYKPTKILKITDWSTKKSYNLNLFEILDNQIYCSKGEDIPYLTSDEYEGKDGDPNDLSDMKKFHVAKPYYSETYIIKKQLLVNYEFVPENNIFTNAYKPLEKFLTKIKNHQNVSITLYGDSIAYGMTSSKLMNREPYIPPFGELLTLYIENHFNIKVNYSNPSIIGMDAKWGKDNAQKLLNKHDDLYIINFGMNDGTGRVPIEEYIANMKEIISSVDKKSEFILISSTLPNPDAYNTEGNNFIGNQEKYLAPLLKLENKRIKVLDMTNFHKWLLERKEFSAISGNNINHPNDFFGRLFAMNLIALLFGENYE